MIIITIIIIIIYLLIYLYLKNAYLNFIFLKNFFTYSHFFHLLFRSILYSSPNFILYESTDRTTIPYYSTTGKKLSNKIIYNFCLKLHAIHTQCCSFTRVRQNASRLRTTPENNKINFDEILGLLMEQPWHDKQREYVQ